MAKELGNDRLWFAKMDGTANDLPPGFDIKGYPTVFFIAAYKKHEPKLYEGDRSTSHFRVINFCVIICQILHYFTALGLFKKYKCNILFYFT